MTKKLLAWGIIAICLTAYTVLVYTWWMEGTYNFEQQKADQKIEYLYLSERR